MSIEIHKPELEALIQQRMSRGGFESVEDVLMEALEPVSLRIETKHDKAAGTGSALIEACARVRGLLSDEEVDSLFGRTLSVSRPVDFE